MTARADTLIAELRQALSAQVVDEDRVFTLLVELIDRHGFGKAELADKLDCPRQALFRILRSRSPDLDRYRLMCNNQSSVLEVLAGMTDTQRQALLVQFEKTGRPYSQAALRRYKQEAQQGKAKPVSASTATRPLRTRTVNWTAQQDHDDAFLETLEKVVKKGLQLLQRRHPSS